MLCLYTPFSRATLHEGERSRSSTFFPRDSMENNEVGRVGKQGIHCCVCWEVSLPNLLLVWLDAGFCILGSSLLHFMGTEVIRRKEGISLYQQMGSLEEFEFAKGRNRVTGTAYTLKHRDELQ